MKAPRELKINPITLAYKPGTLEKSNMAQSLSFRFLLAALGFIFALATNMQSSPLPDPSRSLRLCKVEKVTSSIPPTMDAARYGLDRLLDGELPEDGWRKVWTVWYQKDPVITFDLGAAKKIGAIRIYFQAWSREDELKNIKVAASLDGSNFYPFNEYGEIITARERGAWVEMDLQAVRARYFQISPKFQGWGHQWGEVEFWQISN